MTTPDPNAVGGGGGYIGGEAGGYEDADSYNGFGGGGSGYAYTGGVTNTSGATGTYGAFSDSTRTGKISNNSQTITNITNLSTANWVVGYTISGTGIPSGQTITTICVLATDAGCSVANSVIFGPGNGNGNHTGSTLTVTDGSTTVSTTAGGNTDYYYSPSYLDSTLVNPGKGGTTGTSVDGHAGAVILLW